MRKVRIIWFRSPLGCYCGKENLSLKFRGFLQLFNAVFLYHLRIRFIYQHININFGRAIVIFALGERINWGFKINSFVYKL